jgi:hypothetical protein
VWPRAWWWWQGHAAGLAAVPGSFCWCRCYLLRACPQHFPLACCLARLGPRIHLTHLPLIHPPAPHACHPRSPAGANRDAPLPVKLFEVSDVILLTGDKGCGAANSRRLVAVSCDRSASFEVIHGLLNRVMEVLLVPHTGGWGGGWAVGAAWMSL